MLPTEKRYNLPAVLTFQGITITRKHPSCSAPLERPPGQREWQWRKHNMKLCFIVGATQLVRGHDAQGEGGYMFPHAEALLGPSHLQSTSMFALCRSPLVETELRPFTEMVFWWNALVFTLGFLELS